MNTLAPTTYTSAKVTGRTASEDADGTLTIFQGLEIIGTHDVTGMDSGEIWSLINEATVPVKAEAPVKVVETVAGPDLQTVPAKISPRYSKELYRMRSSRTYRGDRVERHIRRVYGKEIEFTRITWGDGSVTVRAYKKDTTLVLHEWNS